MWVTSYKQRNENGDNRPLEKWFKIEREMQSLTTTFSDK